MNKLEKIRREIYGLVEDLRIVYRSMNRSMFENVDNPHFIPQERVESLRLEHTIWSEIRKYPILLISGPRNAFHYLSYRNRQVNAYVADIERDEQIIMRLI